MDIEAFLPPDPPGYRVFLATANKTPAVFGLYARLASGLLGWSRRIWTHASHGEPLVVEAVIRVYESSSTAERAWRSIPRNPDFYQLIPDVVTISQPDPAEVLIEWRNGGLHFAEVTRLAPGAIISCLSAGRSNRDAPGLLRILHEQMAAKLPPPGVTSVPLLVRQLMLGGAIGLGIAGVAALVVDQLVEGAGGILMLAALGLLISFLALRRVRRKARVRTALRYGDTDGNFRKALSSVGVSLA